MATARAQSSTAAHPPKFKVGDEVIRTDRPFELCEIITQLPVTDAGGHRYRIGPPPMRGPDGTVIKTPAEAKQRNVGENQLMRLEKALDKLLKLRMTRRQKKTKRRPETVSWTHCVARELTMTN